jgi:predicted CoA-binding protein
MRDAATSFLAKRRIAVAGVSRKGDSSHGGNIVYTRLRERGYEVFPVNPNAERVEGNRCYPDLASIPDGVEAVVIATPPAASAAVMQQCVDLGVTEVWIHRSFGGGSGSEEATKLGRDHGIRVIDGGCPLMFGEASDFGHRVMGTVLRLTGTVPREV